MAVYWKVRPKKRISVGLSANVAMGNMVRVSGFIGIPMFHALSGESVTLGLGDGEIAGITFSGQGTVALGTFIYWDTTAAGLSLGAANDDYLVGQVTKAKDSSNEFDLMLLPANGPGMVGGGQ